MAVQRRNLVVFRWAAFLSGLSFGLTQCHADNMAAACLEAEGRSDAPLVADGGTEAVLLLQNRAKALQSRSQDDIAQQQQQRLEKAKPIVWMHVPKCGTTFVNALTQHPGICPGASEENAITDAYGKVFDRLHRSLDIEQDCPSAFFRGESMLGWHDGAGSNYDQYNFEGHLMTVLRNPKSRLISAYNFNKHSWPTHDRSNISLNHYVNTMEGHFLKMLTRDYRTSLSVREKFHIFQDKVTVEEIQKAHLRLEVGFAYVGILEEWPLSMCLFHKMFGSQCVKSEFLHLHEQGEGEKKKDVIQEQELEGFEDPYDTPLYEQALARFRADLQKFDVSADTCQECFAAAGYNPEEVE